MTTIMSVSNLTNIIRQASIMIVVACGSTFVMIGGNIDIAVGAVGCLTSIVTALMMKSGVSMFVAIPVALVLSSFLGMCSGMLVTKYTIPPMIATLAMMNLCTGVANLLTSGTAVYGLPENFDLWGRGYIGPIPMQVVVMVIVAVICKQFYRNCMENHLFPALGDCPLEKLSTIQIQRAINEMSEHGRNHYYSHIPLKETTLSPRIVQGILGILRKSLDQAVAEKLILSNPAANCKAPKTVRKEMKVLPEELIGPYLHEAKQRGVFAPLYLELTSGLRRGELLALLWKDLNVKDRTLSVTKSVCRIDHQLVVSQPKTKNSLRLLTLPESTVQILVEEHEKHPDNPYMFPSPKTGEMLDPASFRAMHDRILEAIGAEHVRFHDMRHTFATLALKNGVDVRTLSEMLGHYSAGFTLSTYVHSTPSMRLQAADTIGQMIGREVV